MAWNEPGGGPKDPWSGKGGGEQGPPDLDEVVRKLQERLGSLFGGSQPPGGAGGPVGGRSGGGGQLSTKVIGVIVGLLIVIWLLTGIYIIEPAERGVEFRLLQQERVMCGDAFWRLHRHHRARPALAHPGAVRIRGQGQCR